MITKNDALDLAKSVVAKVKVKEKDITNVLQSIGVKHNAIMAGLEYRFKDISSIQKKLIETNELRGLVGDELEASVHDALRYTYTIENKDYTREIPKIIDYLTKIGYLIVDDFDNKWHEDDYKGIHISLSATNGQIFELQFHTPEGFIVKQKYSHPIYKKRKETKDPNLRKKLKIELIRIWSIVKEPVGVKKL